MSDLKGLAAREAYVNEHNVARLKMMLAEVMGERDALRAELDALKAADECAVCRIRKARAMFKTCEVCL